MFPCLAGTLAGLFRHHQWRQLHLIGATDIETFNRSRLQKLFADLANTLSTNVMGRGHDNVQAVGKIPVNHFAPFGRCHGIEIARQYQSRYCRS